MRDTRDKERGRQMGRALAAASIAFVVLAEGEQIDDVTISENADQLAPWSAHGRYREKSLVYYEGAAYRCAQAHDAQAGWTPDAAPALWVCLGDPADAWPPWSQPLGAHDAYGPGAQVTHEGARWVSVADGNAWVPGVYGWEEYEK